MTRLLIAALIAISLTACSAAEPSEEPAEDIQEVVSCWPDNQLVDIPAVLQNPDLPTGCEVTALATVTQWLGFDASKETLANIMPKSDTEFVHMFLGDPYSPDGHAIMAPGLEITADTYLAGTGYQANDITGTAFYNLQSKLDAGVPVIIWVTINMEQAQPAYMSAYGYDLIPNTHCVVLLSMTNDYVSVDDPLRGNVQYSTADVKVAYESNGTQAVTIERVI